MLQFSEKAQKKIAELIGKTEQPVAGLRVGARARSPFKVDYRLSFVTPENVSEEDTKIPLDGFAAYVDAESLPLLEEATVDYVEGLMGSGFKIDAPPRVPAELKGTVAEKVVTVIDQEVNPALASHGGYVTLMDVKDSRVYVEMGGGCQGCSMARVTLKEGIERMIKESIPEIQEVVDVTDHAQGEHAYYGKETD